MNLFKRLTPSGQPPDPWTRGPAGPNRRQYQRGDIVNHGDPEPEAGTLLDAPGPGGAVWSARDGAWSADGSSADIWDRRTGHVTPGDPGVPWAQIRPSEFPMVVAGFTDAAFWSDAQLDWDAAEAARQPGGANSIRGGDRTRRG